MEGVIQNPLGAFGLDATGNESAAVVRVVKAGEAISQGDLITLTSTPGSAEAVYEARTNGAKKLIIGVALEDIASGGVGLAVEYGPCHVARKSTGAHTAGDVLTVDATTTGAVHPIGATTAVTQYKDVGIGIGIAMVDKTGGDTTTSIFVCKQ